VVTVTHALPAEYLPPEQWQAKRIAQDHDLLRPVPMRTIRTVTMQAGARSESEWVMASVTASLSQRSTSSNTGDGTPGDSRERRG
jgi:hypothetical protein